MLYWQIVSRDELVIETPTLFEAEEGDSDEEEISTNQYRNQQQESSDRFAIDDEETEDDFEDFADFDDGEPLTNTNKFKNKD